MINDVVFKTKAFGGFDKREVMDFVNETLNEKSDAERRLAEFSEKFNRIKSELAECKAEIEETGDLKSEIIKITSLNTELMSQIEAKDSEIESLLQQMSEKDGKIATLETDAQNNTIDSETQKELEFLRSEVQRLKNECEKKKDLERQVGAAMLDARVHSEELVEAARERANNVTRSVYSAIGDTAVKIDDLSAGIGEIARSFTKSVEEVELRIKALTGDMSKTAQLLISETGMISDSQTEEVEYDFSKDGGDTEEA